MIDIKHIEKIKISDIDRISIVLAGSRTMQKVKADIGCDYIINGGLYDMKTNKPVSHLKVDGKVLASENWGAWGYGWNEGPDIGMDSIPTAADHYANYITCVGLLTPWDGIDAKLDYSSALGGTRGRTAIALTSDGLILYCSKDGTADAATPERLRQELYNLGAVTALMLDSGGSSQCDFGGGHSIQSIRKVHNYICVWRKKEDNKVADKKLTVCLDPGHGPGTVNGSPDGTYKETEFAWDMHLRIKALLEGCGVNVIVTRQEGVKPSLTTRAKVSNQANADLFVSLHSNAAPAVDSDGWSPASGLLIYTSQAGDTAGRNKAAKAILKRMAEAGVKLQGVGLSHYGYTVLTETVAPAILIEYGFHTNKEDVQNLKDPAYREKLAMATAQGICDYLGVEWQMGGDPAPWYAGVQQWAKDMGITDGTRPEDVCTRAEVWEMLKRYTEALIGGGEER